MELATILNNNPTLVTNSIAGQAIAPSNVTTGNLDVSGPLHVGNPIAFGGDTTLSRPAPSTLAVGTSGDASGTVQAGQLQIAGGDQHGLVYGPVGNLGGQTGFSVHSYAVFDSNVYIGGTLATLGAPLPVNASVNVSGNVQATGLTATSGLSCYGDSALSGMTRIGSPKTLASLPPAAPYSGYGTNVSDAASGHAPYVISDGTNYVYPDGSVARVG